MISFIGMKLQILLTELYVGKTKEMIIDYIHAPKIETSHTLH